jgi:hypothetical protein
VIGLEAIALKRIKLVNALDEDSATR